MMLVVVALVQKNVATSASPCRGLPASNPLIRMFVFCWPDVPISLSRVMPLAACAATVHVTVKDAGAVPPEGTGTVCVLPPLTVQLGATPERLTVWLPAASPVNVALPPLVASGWLVA